MAAGAFDDAGSDGQAGREVLVLRRIKRNDLGLDLIDVLNRHKLLRREFRPRQGVSAEMVHIEHARELLRGADSDVSRVQDAVRNFWNEVRRM